MRRRWTGFICEVKSLQWQRLQGLPGRDGVMASPLPPRRRCRWLLEDAEAAYRHVLTASTVTYDQAEHCPIRAYEPQSGLIARLLGAVLEAAQRTRLRRSAVRLRRK